MLTRLNTPALSHNSHFAKKFLDEVVEVVEDEAEDDA